MKQIEISEPMEKSIATNRHQIWYLYEGHKPGVLGQADERHLKKLVAQISLTHGLEGIGPRNILLEREQEQWAILWAAAEGEPIRFVRGFEAVPHKDPKHKAKAEETIAFIGALIATFRIESYVSANVTTQPLPNVRLSMGNQVIQV